VHRRAVAVDWHVGHEVSDTRDVAPLKQRVWLSHPPHALITSLSKEGDGAKKGLIIEATETSEGLRC
jgi:hypothetical protein